MPGFEIFGQEEKDQIMDVLETGVLFRYEFGDQRNGIYKVKEFEEKFALYTGTRFAQAVTSGSAALKVALTALGIGAGDEVITQGFTFVATWEAILEVGAIPVFTEVDTTLNMDPEDLKKKITSNTKCIIPVHMLGSAARIEEIVELADAYNIPVLEDSAQAAGGRLNGKHLGSFGTCGTFSFDSVKTMTTGEGGMVITDSEPLWQRMSEYHDHGHDHAINPGGRGGESRNFIGFNYRMMELQGAIGIAQLAKLDTMIQSQKSYKNRLREAASKIPGVSFRTQLDEQGDSATFFVFTLQSSKHRLTVQKILSEAGVPPICWADNSWHFYPRWEHLLAGKTLARNGWPFCDVGGKKRVVYDPAVLPKSADILSRTLTYPVSVKMADDRLLQMEEALSAAAEG